MTVLYCANGCGRGIDPEVCPGLVHEGKYYCGCDCSCGAPTPCPRIHTAIGMTDDHLRALVLAGGYRVPEGVFPEYSDGRHLPDPLLADVADVVRSILSPEAP